MAQGRLRSVWGHPEIGLERRRLVTKVDGRASSRSSPRSPIFADSVPYIHIQFLQSAVAFCLPLLHIACLPPGFVCLTAAFRFVHAGSTNVLTATGAVKAAEVATVQVASRPRDGYSLATTIITTIGSLFVILGKIPARRSRGTLGWNGSSTSLPGPFGGRSSTMAISLQSVFVSTGSTNASTRLIHLSMGSVRASTRSASASA